MSVVRYNPFREFDHFFNHFERPLAAVRQSDWLPPVDIRETAEGYAIDVELPAVASSDISVRVNDGVLTVSGERKAVERGEDNDKVHRIERRYGRFVRNFQLPEDADVDAVSAESRDGVLYLSIGKQAEKATRSIEVKVA